MSRPRPTALLVATTGALALGAAALVPVTASAATASATAVPFISEIHYDNVGTDAGEAIEVTAALGTDLTGWSVVLYNGASASRSVYDTTVLSEVVNAPAGDPSGDGVVVVTYPTNGIQNGSPDGMALVDADGDVVEFLSYEGSFIAADGPAAGLTSTDIGVAETGSEPLGLSLQKVEGTWAGPATQTFGSVNDTVGLGGGGAGEPEPEPEPEPSLCTVSVTASIPTIQGSGSSTPLAGTTVVTTGVVTADTQAGLSGFFVQDPVGDGDPATSDGIFVFAPGAPDVEIGDAVAVRGRATEFFGLTQVDASAGAVEVCGDGELPEPVVLPFPSTDAEREPFEGMLVTPSEPLSVTGLFQLEQFGEVRLSSGGPLVQGTEAAAPGAPAAAVEAENRTREIVLDDASGANLQNAGIAPPYLTVDDSVRIGDTAQLDSYVLSFGFGNWRLQPATGVPDQVTWLPTNPRTPQPDDVGGDVKVAAFNVLNYFVTIDDGTVTDPEPRGARSPQQFADQEAKIVNALVALDADVVALQEIEYGVPFGKDADVALAALVDALNVAAPAAGEAADWAFVPTPDYVRDSPDVIQNGIIYRTGSVARVGDSVALGTDTEAWDNAREPVAQLFERDGDRFLVVSNHFKSKGATGATGANADQGDGQGAFNADRVLQAQALASAAEDLAAALGEDDVFLMGDFNAYGEEDPITTLEAAGYVDVLEDLDTYTYRFDWRSGNLDHALLSSSAVDKVTGVTIWQVNAAEPFAYTYFGNPALYAPYPYRASDHNPIVVGFDVEPPLGTDVSLADVLARDSFVDRNPDDYDLLEIAVNRVLHERPGSAVGVLGDPTVPLTAFLPTDRAFLATLDAYLPIRVRTELGGLVALYLLDVDTLEEVLLYHVVPGETLEAADVLAADGTVLTTAQGGTVEVDVAADGTITLVDVGTRFQDPQVVATDLNVGQVQVGHGIDRVLIPFDVAPLRLRGLLRP